MKKRNLVAKHLRTFNKGVAHGKTKKASRRGDKINLKKEW